MAYAIFSVKKEDVGKIDPVLRDDMVSRQSIVVRDASSLGIEKDVRYVLIEGSEEAIKKASDLFKGVGKREKDREVYRRFKREEDDVARGIGLIFE